MINHQFRRASVSAVLQKRIDLPRDPASDGKNFVFSTRALDQPSLLIALTIVVLSCILYVPFLRLPLLPDDYLQISLARKWGPVGEWRSIFNDALFRNRATSLILTYWTDLLFPLSRLAFGVSSILLHAANGLLVYSLGTARSIGWRLSAIMAVVFVLQERHHEAVIWYAALPELLVFFFALSSLVLWVRWLRSGGSSIVLWAGMLTCFVLAQFSKESAVAIVSLMIVLAVVEHAAARRVIAGLLPILLVAAVYAMSIFWGRSQNHHFFDGTFALQSGFIKTMLLALQALLERTGSPKLVAVCLIVIGLHHASYLWTAKYGQFQTRSEPIENFIRFLRNESRRPILIRCSDYYFSEVGRAAYLRLGEDPKHFVLDFSEASGSQAYYCLPGPV